MWGGVGPGVGEVVVGGGVWGDEGDGEGGGECGVFFVGGECCGCKVGGVVVVGDDEFGVVVLCSWRCVLWCGV